MLPQASGKYPNVGQASHLVLLIAFYMASTTAAPAQSQNQWGRIPAAEVFSSPSLLGGPSNKLASFAPEEPNDGYELTPPQLGLIQIRGSRGGLSLQSGLLFELMLVSTLRCKIIEPGYIKL